MPANGPPHPTEATPGELLAAANGAFFLGALAESLLRAGTPARELVVEADCEIGAGRVDHRLTAVEISVHGIVDGVDEAAFEASAHDALDRARGWLALEHGLPMNVRAHLRRRGPSH
jgi:organic hydroperoxide reductase OsmC/OhrA